MKKTLVFSNHSDEMRVALLENEKLMEIFFEDLEVGKLTGKIFYGRIENVVPALESFFVNIGAKKNGFLRFKDTTIDPDTLRRGSFIIVQVKKDGDVRKGPQLTMHINIPGKYMVYMPFGENSIGISKKIMSLSEKDRLREIGEMLIENEEEGIIFRTNSENVDFESLKEEFFQLKEIWENIKEKAKNSNKPALLYEDENFVDYILRERFDHSVNEIITDDKELFKRFNKEIKEINENVKIRKVDIDAFSWTNVYEQMDDMFARKIELPGGGVITIDKTEALTVFDIDSAGNVLGENVEDTSYKTNLEATVEIARQLRLRNIAGIILIDFIDMKDAKHKEEIINLFREESKKDKAKISISGFTKLGLLELSRKRTTPSIDALLFTQCPICQGTGKIASPRIVFRRVIKELEESLEDLKRGHNIKEVYTSVYHNLSGYFTKEKKKEIEEKFDVKLDLDFNWPDPNSYNIRYRK
ncbi:ribonuclease, Rne/Rng family [Marinitoga piezophila KA3]|uniref:Ribonuclease, Rne/Rng family n=1 Tax=Marinitoga piezophila (strain DSM 14283 / JCM 11233 / KA3) TaxID=443254 RepID=H2J5W5_MARPK|nr:MULTISPECIES: Rne/Rng family ribonuclease [Marinitoga]AEX86184.1 ribonuclease, Rne/Rng family [Marinitoga piezophila KA3]